MYFNKIKIKELETIITNINTLDENDKIKYLNENVEDVTMFLNILKNINKSKLKTNNRKKINNETNINENKYNKAEVLEIIKQNNNLEELVKNYSKSELDSMYLAIYGSKPLSKNNKKMVVQLLKGYVLELERGKQLLSGIKI